MTSGPYQSKLLRLAIAQYRQGVDRHHRAVRQARSTAVLGVELGTVLALAPVSAAMKVVQNAGVRTRRALAEVGWFAFAADGMKTGANKILNFSDFEAAATQSEDAKAFASLTGSALAEGSMVQTLKAVGLCLSSRQVKALSRRANGSHKVSDSASDKMPDSASETSTLATTPVVGRFVSFGRRSVAGFLRRWDVQDSELANAGAGLAAAQPDGLGALKVTGVASDLETRSLHLVLGNTIVWDGLSARQQARLQRKILRLLEGDIEQRSFLSATFSVLKAKPAMALFGQQSALMRPMSSLWLEVWRAILRRRGSALTWIKQQPWLGPLPRLAERQTRAEALSSFADVESVEMANQMTLVAQPASSAVSAGSGTTGSSVPLVSALMIGGQDIPSLLKGTRVSSQQSKAAKKIVDLVSQGMEGTQSQRRQADYWEADVIAIDYIEHPLETVLKWVDRILLWIETQWQVLKSWLSRLVT